MVETTDVVNEIDLTTLDGTLDDIDDGDEYLRVGKDRGRPDYFGIPRFFKFQGEHELGYTIVEETGGTVEVLKDKLTVSTTDSVDSSASIESAERRADFSKKPSVVVRFKLNDVASNIYRQHYFGLYSGSGHRAHCIINTSPDPYTNCILKSYTSTGVAPSEEKTMESTLLEATWYVVEIYVKDSKVEFYLDGVLKTTHTSRVPTTGTAATLYVRTYTGWSVDEGFSIEISHYEVNQEW